MPRLKMTQKSLSRLNKKKLVVFDLDGTLAPSKSVMDKEMAKLLEKLLSVKKVAVIGGGKYEIFKFQLLNELTKIKAPALLLQHLYLFPTTATAFYKHHRKWDIVYSLKLKQEEVKKIKQSFNKAFAEIGYKHPKKVYGELIENRGTQVSWSVYGQDVVAALGKKGVKMKEEWKKKYTPVKMKIAALVSKYLPEFEVHAAGFTTIDVTKKGIDKAYGLKQIEKYLGVKIKDMVFIGDAIFPGGNDYAVTKTVIQYLPVSGPEETKKAIKAIIG